MGEVFGKAYELLAERPMLHGPVLPRLVTALVRLLAAAAPNGAAKCEVVPSAAEVLKALLTGPFEYPAAQQLPAALKMLPKPLSDALGEAEQQRLVQQLKMEKGDSRRFTRTVITL